MDNEDIFDVIVIGAGQSGLAAAYWLKLTDLKFLVLEAEDDASGSWGKYYKSLTLFSPAKYSSLPGCKFPGDDDHYPKRDEVISYLHNYVEKFSLPIKYKSKVIEVTKPGGLFRVITQNGEVFVSKFLIAASGSFSNPYTPHIDGMEKFKGRIIHSYDYKDSRGLEGKKIIVVGGGNSAVQIAVELAEKSKVTLATLKPIFYLPQKFLGLDGHFWLKYLLLDRLKVIKDMSTPVVDAGNYRQKIKQGSPERKQMFKSFYENGVVWENGEREEADIIIFATGFKPSVGYLKDLNVTGKDSNIIHKKGICTAVEGLYFVGLSGQTGFASATLRGAGRDAKFIVNQITAKTGELSNVSS